MEIEETKPLSEIDEGSEYLGSTVQAQENGAGVPTSGVVVETRVVETEISVEKTLVGPNGSDVGGDGGSIEDAKVTGVSSCSGMGRQDMAENGGGIPGVNGLADGGSNLVIGEGSDKGTGLEQNGISGVVDVHGSLDSVNESGKICGYENDKGYVAENEGNPADMESTGLEGNINNEANHNGDEEKEDGEEDDDEGDEEHEYSVGDFVWGKIRSHPWWPGRIYDPLDASEYARKYSQGEKLLVAYFGDGSFSWCSPSQLKPFAEDFEEMAGQSNSKSFLNAVQNAVDELDKLVELKMTCSCISDSDRIELDRYPALNAGIKQGVLVPECDLSRLLIPINGPTELLSTLRYIAEVVSITSMLEFTVLRSWLSAFYRAKGAHKLPMYYEPLSIEGLEDKNRKGVTDINDFSGPVAVPFEGPSEEDWLSSPVHPGLGQTNQSLLQKCPGIAEDKLYGRKKKSVAELMEDDMVVNPNEAEARTVKDAAKVVSGNKKGKSSDEALIQAGIDLTSPSGRKKGRGKRAETLESAKSYENEVPSSKNGGGEGDEESKKDDVSSVGNYDSKANEETEKASARGRKRGRGKRAETQGSAKSAEKKDGGAKNGSGEGEEESKRDDVSSAGNDDDKAKEETEKASAPGRKRGRGKRAETQGSVKSAEKKVRGATEGGGEGEEETRREDVSSAAGNDDREAKEETEEASASGRKRGRGKRAETQGFAKSSEKKVRGAKKASGEGEEDTKKRDDLSIAESDDTNAKEVTEKGSASRERKKSKYLSPPFTSVKLGVRNLSSERDIEAESEKISKVARIGERMSRAASHLFESPPVLNCSDETKADTPAILSPNPPSDQMKNIDAVEISASPKEVIFEVRSAALNPLHLKERSSVDTFRQFVSAFRSAIYLNGSNYKIFHRRRPGRKRESSSSGPDIAQSISSWTRTKGNEQEKSGVKKLKKADGELGLLGKDPNQMDPEIAESKSKRARTKKNNPEKSGVKKLKQADGELGKKKKKKKKTIDEKKDGQASTAPVSLMLTFPPGFSLPSKNDLNAVFSKFGALNELETEVFYDSSCARVVFVKSSDAEEAFNASMEKSPFGPAKVSYQLRYSSVEGYQKAASPKEGDETPVNPSASKPAEDDASRVILTVKRKLEMMTSMLEKSDGNMLPEMRSNLEVEMKGLLEEVSTVTKSTSA